MLNIFIGLILWFIFCFFVIGLIVVLVQKHKNKQIATDDDNKEVDENEK